MKNTWTKFHGFRKNINGSVKFDMKEYERKMTVDSHR